MAETKVKLSCKAAKETDREFEITHAQNLLDLEKKHGFSNWELTDKNFMLKDGTIQRANNKPPKGTEGEGSAGQSAQA